MKRHLSKAFLLPLTIALTVSAAGIAGASDETRASYEKYQKSYNEFKKAVESGLSNEKLKDFAEKYKADLEDYKKILSKEHSEKNTPKEAEPDNAAVSTPAAAEERTAGASLDFEQTVIDLHSGDISKLDGVITRLTAIISSSKDKTETGMAKYELANAYMMKNDFEKSGGLLKEIMLDKSNPMSADAKNAYEKLSYLKNKFEYAAGCYQLKEKAQKAKNGYESLDWKNPIKKIMAKGSQITSALKYRFGMARLQDYSSEGRKSAFSTAKLFVTDLIKKGIDPENGYKDEKELLYNIVEWKKRQRIAALINKSDGIYKLCNVRWGFDGTASGDENKITPRWRTATVNTDAVKEAYFVVKPFAPEWIAGHCFFMFEFDENSPVTTDRGEKSYGFIMSMEAHQKEGQNYSFTGSFGVVYLLLSKEDYIQICAVNKSRLIPYKLNLSTGQKKGLIRCAIEEALEERGMERYDLFENNCTNILFGMLNKVLPENQRFREWVIKDVLYNKALAIPKAAPKFLKKHGLIAEAMPTIYPDAKNLEYPANAAASGAAKDDIISRTDRVKSAYIDSIENKKLDAKGLKKLFYNENADMVFALSVPGVEPEARSNGAFSIDETGFTKKIDSLKNSEELKKYVSELFDSYKAAVEKRLSMKGPDVSGYLSESLDSLEKTLSK